MTDELAIADKVMEQAARVIEASESEFEAAIEVLKLRVSYFDKLIVLNAGTMALSFSAVFTFIGHAGLGKQGIPIQSVLDAWKCLMVSIIAALLSNWLTTNLWLHMRGAQFGFISRTRQFIHALEMRRLDSTVDVSRDSPTEETFLASHKKKMRRGGWLENVALFLGTVSQASTLYAFRESISVRKA